MNKRALPALILLVCLFMTGVYVQAEEAEMLQETEAEKITVLEEAAEQISNEMTIKEESVVAPETGAVVESEVLLPGEVKLSFSAFPASVCLGEKLIVTVTVDCPEKDATCGAVWLFNKNPIPGFSNENFSLQDKKTSTLCWDITEDWRGWGDMEVGFKLYNEAGTLSEVYQSFRIEDITREEKDKEQIMQIVKPVCVEGRIRYNTTLYKDVMLTTKIGTVEKDATCQILNSKSGYSNQILLADGRRGWVGLPSLDVSKKNYTKETDISNREKDLFVNTMGYKSKTEYLVWVHLECQKVNVFLRKGDRWCIESVFPCASGKNETPTINGVFTYSARNNRWTYEKYYVAPALIFSGNYALHSVLMRYDGTIYDGTIGRPASNGCVRMLPDDINWMADYVPFGTTVVVY
ncbi:MAG: L,D-transpeptidase [Clostridia bacterium]|nr:L,D-transpeptidase [Clostridia bacterium]